MNIRAKIFGNAEAVDDQPILDSKKPKGAKADMLHSVSVPREEVRRSNTRTEDRHRLAEEAGSVKHKGKTYAVELINVSGGGAMVSASFEPKLWDRVELRLGEDGVIECAVRWLRDDRIGLEFAHETRLDCSREQQATVLRQVIQRSFDDIDFNEPESVATTEPAPARSAESSDDHRGDRRHPLIWSGALHYDFQSIPVRLRNISSTGALIDCPFNMRVGAEPLLDLGDAGSIFATVAWVVGEQVGLKFQNEFDLSQLSRNRPQVAPAQGYKPDYLRAADEKGSGNRETWGRLSLSELRDELEGYMKH